MKANLVESYLRHQPMLQVRLSSKPFNSSLD